MVLEDLRSYLFPSQAEDDPGFRDEILRHSVLSLKVIGGIEIAVSCFLTTARFFIQPDPSTLNLRLTECALIVAIGLFTIWLGRQSWVAQRARLLACLSGFVTAAALTWYSLLLFPPYNGAEDFIPFQVTMVLLVGVATIPMRPIHTLALGGAILAAYWAEAALAARLYYPGTGVVPINALFIVTLTLLATGLVALLYHQRYSNYQSHVNNLKSVEDLREAQARILLGENAASMARLAAALSHELNSPIGALMSGVDTLLLLAGRQATSPPQDQPRLVALQGDVRKSIKESAERLSQLVTRMQRFTNLDRAEVQLANLNELLGDVAILMEPQLLNRASLEMDLNPVPPLVCRPQQLSAVFGNLISNAINAVNGDGRIVVRSHETEGSVEIEITDNGHGVSEDDLETIFDPGFKVVKGRVRAGNWGMFSSRQIVREHGGDIKIRSGSNGTTVRVVLPLKTGSFPPEHELKSVSAST